MCQVMCLVLRIQKQTYTRIHYLTYLMVWWLDKKASPYNIMWEVIWRGLSSVPWKHKGNTGLMKPEGCLKEVLLHLNTDIWIKVSLLGWWGVWVKGIFQHVQKHWGQWSQLSQGTQRQLSVGHNLWELRVWEDLRLDAQINWSFAKFWSWFEYVLKII